MKKTTLIVCVALLSTIQSTRAMITIARRHYSINKRTFDPNRNNGHNNTSRYRPLRAQPPIEGPLTIEQMETILRFMPIDRKKQVAIKTIIAKTKALSQNKDEALFRLQRIFQLPWGLVKKPTINISSAQSLLNKKIFGMHKAKDSIMDEFALRHMNPEGKGNTICFVGQPGTGKTALAEVIADTLDLSYGHVALAGSFNGEIIRGSLSTYKDAAEGEITKILSSCEISNPVILLDEIDKTSKQEHGALQSTLLQLLDPTQNHNFFDNYLGIPIDVSKVTFIATANYLENISEPLKNRLHIIQVPAYTLEEKITIVKDFILPKLNEQTGLHKNKIPLVLNEDVIRNIITNYTQQEHGVRQLEKMVKTLCAKQAREYLTNKKTLTFTKESLAQYLTPMQEENLKKTIW